MSAVQNLSGISKSTVNIMEIQEFIIFQIQLKG